MEMEKELHRIVTTCVIYNDKGQFLITKRSPTKKVHPSKWTIPGGGLSTDDYVGSPATHGANAWENVVETAQIREIKEEVGVEIADVEYLLNFAFIRPDNIPVLVMTYCARYVSGDVILDEDATEFAWISLAQAQDYDLIDGIHGELEYVAKKMGFA